MVTVHSNKDTGSNFSFNHHYLANVFKNDQRDYFLNCIFFKGGGGAGMLFSVTQIHKNYFCT